MLGTDYCACQYRHEVWGVEVTVRCQACGEKVDWKNAVRFISIEGFPSVCLRCVVRRLCGDDTIEWAGKS